jgi:hypothetical protein
MARQARGSDDIVEDLAALGPFFAVQIHRPGASSPGSDWRRFDELVAAPHRLDRRVRAVGRALSGQDPKTMSPIDLRIAASTAQFGIVARLLAPSLAVAVLTGRRVSLAPADLWWQDRLGRPFPLSVQLHSRESREMATIAGSAVESVTLMALLRYGVPQRVLWGNVASAVNAAAQLIAVARPDFASAAVGIADQVLSNPRLEGGRLRSAPDLRRASCCLVYRVTGATVPVCADCVLRDVVHSAMPAPST